MAVTFTPGPHPTSQSRSTSTTSIQRFNPPNPQKIRHPPTPPRSISTRQSSLTIFADPNADFERGNVNENEGGDTGSERLPLLSTGEFERPRIFYSVLGVLAVVLVFGGLLGFGAWRLGKGEGGGRWPGGPH